MKFLLIVLQSIIFLLFVHIFVVSSCHSIGKALSFGSLSLNLGVSLEALQLIEADLADLE